MKNALALVVVAGLASSAFATSTVSIMSSVNGGAFAASNNVNTGDVVRVRVIASSDRADVVGLAGATFNITAANFNDSALAPWSPSDPSSAPLGPGVQDLVNGNGRLAPFAASAATSLPTSSLSAGVLTIGGSGTGGRIAIGQNAPTLAGTRFVASNPVAIFQFTFTVGSNYNLGDNISIVVSNFLNQATTGARWYNNLNGTTAVNDPNPVLTTGVLTFVPTPGSLALLGLGGLVAGRRRR
jgi:uncharacterized protein (TIGR03382 family)